ncbi:MAG: hypothetical protein NT098_00235 [Candidatus Parcubacteria bacterium]|nr:hypothetical protein [Candidatus Parcubacteria bacterium]
MDHTNYINKVKKASELRKEFVKKAGVLFDRVVLFNLIGFILALFLAIVAMLYGWNHVVKDAFFAPTLLFLFNGGLILWTKSRKQKLLKAFAESFPEESEILEQNKKEQEAIKE